MLWPLRSWTHGGTWALGQRDALVGVKLVTTRRAQGNEISAALKLAAFKPFVSPL